MKDETKLNGIPCPYCGALIKGQDFESEKAAMTWVLERCTCAGANAWRNNGRPELLEESPCASKKMEDGKCGWVAYATVCSQEKCSAYHPELYVPEMYANAYLLAEERQKRESAEKAFEREAQVIRRALLYLPEPAPYWEPVKIRTGCCRYCGQIRVLPHTVDNQEKANDFATAQCQCPAARTEHNREQQKQIIEGLFGDIVEQDVIELLYDIAEAMRDERIKSGASIKISENVTAKMKLKDGTVIATRAEKTERQHSI